MFILRKYFGGSLPIDQDTLVLTAAKVSFFVLTAIL